MIEREKGKSTHRDADNDLTLISRIESLKFSPHHNKNRFSSSPQRTLRNLFSKHFHFLKVLHKEKSRLFLCLFQQSLSRLVLPADYFAPAFSRFCLLFWSFLVLVWIFKFFISLYPARLWASLVFSTSKSLFLSVTNLFMPYRKWILTTSPNRPAQYSLPDLMLFVARSFNLKFEFSRKSHLNFFE